jgi:RHS repeat-associated protein
MMHGTLLFPARGRTKPPRRRICDARSWKQNRSSTQGSTPRAKRRPAAQSVRPLAQTDREPGKGVDAIEQLSCDPREHANNQARRQPSGPPRPGAARRRAGPWRAQLASTPGRDAPTHWRGNPNLVDGQNRRVGKKKNGTLVKVWIYRDQLHPVEELDSAFNLVKRFVYASGKNSPDYMIQGANTYRILSDQLGSPRLIVNTSGGAIAQRMRHDEFGIVLEDTSPGFTPFGFAGGLYDPDTGLVRFGARDYDPSVGRWISKDPIRFEGGQGNLYEYVNNDPVNTVDRSGRQSIPLPWWGPIVGGAVAGGAVAGVGGVERRSRTLLDCNPRRCGLQGAILGAAIVSVPGDTPIPANDNACDTDDSPPPEPPEICVLEDEMFDACYYVCPNSGATIQTKRHGLGAGYDPANDVGPRTIVRVPAHRDHRFRGIVITQNGAS